MYSQISLALAEERVRDMRSAAAGAHISREARLSRPARRTAPSRFGWTRRTAERRAHHNVRVPDSYEDFLCRTAESAMRERAATGRAGGQTVR